MVTLLGWLQYFGFDPLYAESGRNEFPASTFGFQNMTAKFVGFSVLLAAIYWKSNTRFRNAIGLLILSSLLYLYVLKSRAILLALVGALAILFSITNRKNAKRKYAILFIVIFSSSAIFWKINHDSEYGKTKEANSQIRLIRWNNTLQMVRDHPFGIGFGNFPDRYLSYRSRTDSDPESNENMIVKSPHNAYLGFAAEAGIGLLAFAL